MNYTRQIKKALNRLGYYIPYEKTGITGIPDANVFAGLKKFQADHALPVTGSAKPGDETVAALNNEAAKKKSGQYIWRTAQDDKVRPAHAALNGTVRDLADSPDPGEEFNCRCWAEFVSTRIETKCEEEERAWINAEALLFIAKQNLELAQKEEARLISKKLEKELELTKIKSMIEKEKKNKENARRIGSAVGAIAGGIISSEGGPGSIMTGASIGMGAGSKFGPVFEEVLDAATQEKTDFTLKTEKARLEKEIQDLQIKIEEVKKMIKDAIVPNIKAAEKSPSEAKENYMACLKKHAK